MGRCPPRAWLSSHVVIFRRTGRDREEDASSTAALVTVVEDCRAATGTGLIAVGRDATLLHRWCDRVVDGGSLGDAAAQPTPL